MGLAIEILTHRSLLHGVSEDWRRLAVQRGNPFITPDWLECWLETCGQDAEPLVVVARTGAGDVVGVLPLVVLRRAGLRITRFAGAEFGDRFHVAAPQEAEAEVAQAALDTLALDRRFGITLLENVPGGADWLHDALARRRLHASAVVHRSGVSLLAEIEGQSWDEYLAGRSRHFRAGLKRELKALEQGREVSFRLVSHEPDLEGELRSFFDLHDRRWQDRGGSGALGERARAFHRRFAVRALDHGWLRLWFLEVDGEPVAAWYGWSVGGRYAYYLGGFDPRWAKASVGRLLVAHTVRAATEEGASVYDLLTGGEAYKSRFATGEERVGTWAVTRALGPMRAAVALEALARRTNRRLPSRLRRTLARPVDSLARHLPSSVDRA